MTVPYIFFKFLGINSFIGTLKDSNTNFTLFKDDFSPVFEKYSEILNKEDTIATGILSKDDQNLFFAELGIKITKSYTAYFVYIFDHHPTVEDMNLLVEGLEDLVNENLENIDPSELARNMNKGGSNSIN